MSLVGIALLVGLILTVVSVHRIGRRNGFAHDESFVLAWVVLGVCSWVLTESLGIFNLVAALPLAAGWLTTGLVSAVVLRRTRSREGVVPAAPWTVGERAVVVLLGAMLAVLLVPALSAPNNWDSMTYHLPRVWRWLEQGSVAHFPTNIPRQNFHNPLAEMLILQLVAATGDDRLVVLVQWMACIVVLATTMALVRRYGGTRTAGLAAALFLLTSPMVILQASSTQNDLVAASFLCASALFWRMERNETGGLLAGAALGLAWLTKATTGLICAPLLFLESWRAWKEGRAAGLRRMGIGVIVAVLMSVPFWARNLQTYGHPLGLPGHYGQVPTVGAVTSNVLRNAALHAVVVPNPSPAAVEAAVRAIHATLGLDPDDPRTTYPDTRFELVFRPTHEDYAGSGWHLLLLLVAGCVFVFEGGSARGLSLAIGAAALLFAAVLRWQPWHTRLHLPLFALAAPLAGLLLVRMSPVLRAAVFTLLLAVAAPALVANELRPLVGEHSVLVVPRESQYFAARPSLEKPTRDLVGLLRAEGTTSVGLVTGIDEWEFPLLVLAPDIRFDQVTGAGDHPPRTIVLAGSEVPDWLPTTHRPVADVDGRFSVWKALR